MFKKAPHSIVSFFKNNTVADLYLYLIIILYPLLPPYFVLFGARVSTILAFLCLFMLFTAPQFYRLSLSIPKLLVFSIIFLCYVFPSVFNGEVFSTEFVSFLSSYLIIPTYCAILVDSKSKFDKMASTMIASAMVLCCFSLLELVFHYNIFSLIETVKLGAMGPGSMVRFGIYRIESSFGQAIAFAIYLSFILCLVFYKLFKKENQTRFKQNLYLIIVLLLNIFIFLTISRFPILIVLIADFIFFWKLNKKSKIKVAISVGVIVTVIIVFSLFNGGSFFKILIDNILGIAKGDSSTSDDNSLAYRLALYQNSLKVIGNDYFFGRGLHVNTFFIMLSPYYGLFASTSFDNGFVYIFLMQGIFGLLGWIIFCFSCFHICISTYKKNVNDHINFPIFILILLCIVNMFSVARLDESRSFMVIIGCYLGLSFNSLLKEEQRGFDCYEIII